MNDFESKPVNYSPQSIAPPIAELIESKTLTIEEMEVWIQSLATIKRGWETFVEVGQALRTIRESMLYREEYSTWDDFCREVVGWSKSQATRQIQVSHVVVELKIWPTGVNEDGSLYDEFILPQNESQARSLVAIRDAKHRQYVWNEIVRRRKGRRIHAEQVKKVGIEPFQLHG